MWGLVYNSHIRLLVSFSGAWLLYLSFSLNEVRLAVPLKEVWPHGLSVLVKEVWLQGLSTSLKDFCDCLSHLMQHVSVGSAAVKQLTSYRTRCSVPRSQTVFLSMPAPCLSLFLKLLAPYVHCRGCVINRVED